MKNYNIKAALFDLDGVVVFTDKYHYLAWKKLSDERGWEFNEEINNKLRGIPRLSSLEEILKYNNIELDMEEKQELSNIKNQYYVEFLNEINEKDIFDGVIEFIDRLRKRGIKIALCSSSKNAELVLEKLGICYLFDEVITGKDVINSKPDPEIFLLASERLNIPEFHCVVFEDALAGISAAKKAGMKSVGVANDSELSNIADTFIFDYSEIDIDCFLESGQKKSLPISEDKIIENDFNAKDLRHMESMFSLGNGYIGLRGTYDEEDIEIPMCSGMYINGVFANYMYNHICKFVGFADKDEFTVNLADWRIFNLFIDGEKACFSANNIKQHQRELDMINGKIDRKFIFMTKTGKKALVESCRMVSMNDVHTAQIKYTVTPLNFSGEVRIQSKIIKNIIINDDFPTSIVKENENDNVYTFIQRVNTTSQDVAMAFVHKTNNNEYKKEIDNNENYYSINFDITLNKGETFTVEKYAAFSCYLDDVNNIEEDVITKVLQSSKKSFDFAINKQSEFWKKHWKTGDVIIEGNPADQQAIRFGLFQLRQQLATINQCSIGATGLTGPGYSGKVFWDTEMYLMPYYNFTNPETQKELLMYRYRILDKARERAKEFNTVGAMYSWCSIDGEETSTVYEASTAEYHLNSDIAYSIWRYVDTTNDVDFLYNYGAEIVFETAKFMAHRGRFIPNRDNKFCVNVVCGPDEYSCGVSNNMYTNFMLQEHLNYASFVAQKMKTEVPEKFENLKHRISLDDTEFELWKKAAENMYYRYNEKLGIHEQDDSFLYKDPVDMNKIPKNVDIRYKYHPLDLWRMQISKQADVVLLNFIQGDKFTYEEKQRDYEFYEYRCNHGSSLSTAIYSIMACELRKKEAYEFFRCSAYMDIRDFKKNTADGLHLACLGGVWMSVINGFLGMRHYKDGLHFKPFLAEYWNGIECSIFYKDARVKIHVHRENTEFSLIEGENLSFYVNDELVELTKQSNSKIFKNIY